MMLLGKIDMALQVITARRKGVSYGLGWYRKIGK